MSLDENKLEQEIREKNLNAPRLTPQLIDSKIAHKSFHKITDVLTVCVLTLQNGYVVAGKAACASPENYNKEISEKIAFNNARDEIWALEGYLLKQKLFEENI